MFSLQSNAQIFLLPQLTSYEQLRIKIQSFRSFTRKVVGQYIYEIADQKNGIQTYDFDFQYESKNHNFFNVVLMSQLTSFQWIKIAGKSRLSPQVRASKSQLQHYLSYQQNVLKSPKKSFYTIIYSQTNMSSPIYPFIFPQHSLQQTHFSYLLHTSCPQPLQNTQSSQYLTSFLYTTLQNYTPSQYFFYQSQVSTNQAASEVNLDLNPQQSRQGYNRVQLSGKSFSTEREPKIQQGEASASIKKEEENSLTQNDLVQKKIEKKKKKYSKKPKDSVYIPFRGVKKDNSKKRYENQNRNIIPNEISQILSYLHKRGKSEYILKRAWAKYPPASQSYSINRFYLLQNHLRGKVGHYCNEKSLMFLNDLIEPECKIWSQNQQRHYIMLSRVLIGYFLREDSIFSILTSRRMKFHKKQEHLRFRRLLTDIVKRVLKN